MGTTILKIPFDLGIMDVKKRGTSKAPEILASELKKKVPGLKVLDVNVNEDFNWNDRTLYEISAYELENGNRIISLGGDHSVTFSLARSLKAVYPNSCIIIFDAHSDCEDDFIPPSHEGVTRALASTCFAPEEILLVGYRKAHTKEEKDFIKKHKIKHIASKNIDKNTIKILNQFISKYDAAYLSVDIDVFDPKDAPGTGWPENGGPNKEILINLFKELNKSEKLKSFDLVEASPVHDQQGITLTLASDLLEIFATPKG